MSLICEHRSEKPVKFPGYGNACLCNAGTIFVRGKLLRIFSTIDEEKPGEAAYVYDQRSREMNQICTAPTIRAQNDCNGNPNRQNVDEAWKKI